MEDHLRTLAVAGIESRLDAILTTLATKADLHEALHAQTRKMIGAFFGLAGVLLAGIEFLR